MSLSWLQRIVTVSAILPTLVAAPAYADHDYVSSAVSHTPRCVIITKSMTQGSTNIQAAGQVTLLQDFLKRYGYFNTSPSGTFGPTTATALRAFQADHALGVTGLTDGATQGFIHRLTCSTTAPLAGGPAVLCRAGSAYCPNRTYAATNRVTLGQQTIPIYQTGY